MRAAAEDVVAGATDVPEGERQRDARVQVEVHTRVVTVHERTEGPRVVGHRETEDGPV